VTADQVAGLALGIGWAIVVAVAAGGRQRVVRRPALPTAVEGRLPTSSRGGRSPLASLGAAIRRLVPPGAPPLTSPSSTTGTVGDDAADRRTGWAALAGGGLLLVAPMLAAVPVAWAVAAPLLTARRDRARHEARLHDQLPDVVDLLALTTAAGLPVAVALVAIGDRPGGPLGAALARAAAHIRHGGSTGEALAVLACVGPAARPLVDALAQHDRYGSPLLPALERVAIEARSRRRRRAEEAARRLPVTLLFPLVLTTFPAFVLLTVVPLLAGSLGSLSLSPT
jgi:tight adherence protein C